MLNAILIVATVGSISRDCALLLSYRDFESVYPFVHTTLDGRWTRIYINHGSFLTSDGRGGGLTRMGRGMYSKRLVASVDTRILDQRSEHED